MVNNCFISYNLPVKRLTKHNVTNAHGLKISVISCNLLLKVTVNEYGKVFLQSVLYNNKLLCSPKKLASEYGQNYCIS